MSTWVKYDDTHSADAFATALGETNNAILQALLVGPKDPGHMSALETYIQGVDMQIQMNHVIGNDNEEAAGHLKALKAYVEMSSFTYFLPGGIPVLQVNDVSNQLRMHLQCAQEILQERHYHGSQKDKMDPFLADLVDMEPKVASAIAHIENGAQDKMPTSKS